jgi:lysophospholipase L1-like esterase
MSPLEKFAERYIPLYGARWRMRAGLDARLRYDAPRMLDCGEMCVNDALNYLFGKQQGVDVTALNNAVDDSQKVLYNAEAYDFEKQLGKAFLPYMIQIAQENGFTLVLVRTKTLTYPELNTEPPGLRSYSASLAGYLNSQANVMYIDLSHDARFTPQHYTDSLHLNAEGKKLFTATLAEELKQRMK